MTLFSSDIYSFLFLSFLISFVYIFVMVFIFVIDQKLKSESTSEIICPYGIDESDFTLNICLGQQCPGGFAGGFAGGDVTFYTVDKDPICTVEQKPGHAILYRGK
jgi:hypothetical protein